MGGPINKNLNPLGPATKFLQSGVFSRGDPSAAGAAAPMASPATAADVPSMPPAEPAAAVTPADVSYGTGKPAKKRRKTGTVMTSAQGVMGSAPVDRKSLLGS